MDATSVINKLTLPQEKQWIRTEANWIIKWRLSSARCRARTIDCHKRKAAVGKSTTCELTCELYLLTASVALDFGGSRELRSAVKVKVVGQRRKAKREVCIQLARDGRLVVG